MDVTKYYQFPLQWDQYPTDRDLIAEALVRIDSAIQGNAGGGTGSASNVVYDGIEAKPGEDVAEALDKLIRRTDTFEIAMNATSGADSGEALWVYDVVSAFTLPANLTGSRGTVLPIVPLDMVIRIERGALAIGSISIVNNILTFDFPVEQSFAVGDVLVLTSNNTTTFRSVSVTLLADQID